MNGMHISAIPQVLAALQILQEDPERLALERQQYSQSPPPYSSGETTQPPSPPAPLSEVDRRMKRRRERLQSTPGSQFNYQWRRERERIIEQFERRRERRKETLPYDRSLDYTQNARENVKTRWMEQGIWNSKWTTYTVGAHWKHEEDPTLSPEPSPDPEPPNMMIFGKCVSKKPEKSKRTSLVTAEQQASHEQKTLASRPYHQFVYQISKEREWLEDEMYGGVVDFDREASKNVKNSWIKQKIWNPRWDDIPGQTWMHEEPAEEDPGTCNGFIGVMEGETRSQNGEHSARSLQSLDQLSLSVLARTDSVIQDPQWAAAGVRTEIEENVENRVDRLTATDDQNDNGATEEDTGTGLESRRTQAKESAPSSALPPSRSMLKRKRGGNDEAGGLQESRSHETHTIPPQRKRSRTDRAVRHLAPPRVIPSSKTTPTTSRKAGSLRRSMRSRGEIMENSTDVLHVARPTPAHSGGSDTVDHLGRRRSPRIQERRGTEKSTFYDEIVGGSKSKFDMDAQQKRERNKNRPSAVTGITTRGRLSKGGREKSRENGALREAIGIEKAGL